MVSTGCVLVVVFVFQKPVEKRLRTFKQHKALEESKIKDTIPTVKPAERNTGKSLSRDLLKKVKILPVDYLSWDVHQLFV